jgi:hypothetical protein
MKCPECSASHKYKEGVVCVCGYRFALDPKQSPNISDMFLQNAIDKISDHHNYYFTYNQLYAQVYRMLKKKKLKERIISTIGLGVFLGFVLFFFSASTGLSPLWLFTVLICGVLWFAFRRINIPHETIVGVIDTYQKVHPIRSLVDGKQLQRIDIKELDDEIFQHAPEQILIVEHDDIAEMLIMNRFYFENKTLVVSANKYPEFAFEACQKFIAEHPDLPVHLMHDASKKGHGLLHRLVEDKTWHLEGKNLKDLGLFPWDVDRIKHPVWLPGTRADYDRKARSSAASGKSSTENIEQGFIMPLDMVPSLAMMGTVALAVTTGYALMSDEFLTEQRRATVDSGSSSDSGYG